MTADRQLLPFSGGDKSALDLSIWLICLVLSSLEILDLTYMYLSVFVCCPDPSLWLKRVSWLLLLTRRLSLDRILQTPETNPLRLRVCRQGRGKVWARSGGQGVIVHVDTGGRKICARKYAFQ